MNKTPFILLFLLFFMLAGVMVEQDQCYAQNKYVIKFATVAPDGSTWVNAMRRLDIRLKEKTNGRVSFRIYAGGIAGDEIDVIKKIRIGQLHCAAFSGVGITEILPMWRIMDLPFLFRNMDEINLVHREFEDMFAKEFRKSGFEYLAWAEVGDVHLFSRKKIDTRADLQGLKIWTWSGDPVSKATFSAMGVSPVPLSVTDVTTALSTNMIDTVYAPVLGALAMQWHSQSRYMTALPIAHSTGAILISEKFFNRMPEDLQDILKAEINVSMNELSSELAKQARDAVDVIKGEGIEVIPEPEGSKLEDFRSIKSQVAESLTGKVYPLELLEKVYTLLDDYRSTK